jgi:hypothetical protein
VMHEHRASQLCATTAAHCGWRRSGR